MTSSCTCMKLSASSCRLLCARSGTGRKPYTSLLHTYICTSRVGTTDKSVPRALEMEAGRGELQASPGHDTLSQANHHWVLFQILVILYKCKN